MFMGINKNCNQRSNVSSKNQIISAHGKYGDHQIILGKQFTKFCQDYFQNDQIVQAKLEIQNSAQKLVDCINQLKIATIQQIQSMQFKQQLGPKFHKLMLPLKQALLSVLNNITCEEAYDIWNIVNKKQNKSYKEKIDQVLKSFYQNSVKTVSSKFKDIRESMIKTKKTQMSAKNSEKPQKQQNRVSRRVERNRYNDRQQRVQTHKNQRKPRQMGNKQQNYDNKKEDSRRGNLKYKQQERKPRRQYRIQQLSRSKSKKSRYQSVESHRSSKKPVQRQNNKPEKRYHRQPKRQQQNQNNRQKPRQLNEGQVIYINQIQHYKGGIFKIRVKVLQKLDKTFELRGKTKCILKIGDSTGIAQFVCNEDYCLDIDDIFTASDCKVFIFKGTKQIQDSQATTIKINANKSFPVKTDYNFSIRNKYKGGRTHQGDRGNFQRRTRGDNKNRGERGERGERTQRNERGDRDERVNRGPSDSRGEYRGGRQKRQEKTRKQDDLSSYSNNFESKSQSNLQFEVGSKLSDEDGSDYEEVSKAKISKAKTQMPTKITKIKDIQPGEEKISIIAQVFNIKSVNSRYQCLLADDTGCVQALLPSLSIIRQNSVLQFLTVDADVLNEHIKITTNPDSKIQNSIVKFSQLNLKTKISQQRYEEIDDDD